MHVVILTWSKAENDPFEFAYQNYANLLKKSGRLVVRLDLTNPEWPNELQILKANGVEFVLTFQGLGTKHYVDGKSIWDLIQLPLVCLHGDHPCHWPDNHRLDSRYCLHVYANAEWAEYANRHFHKRFAATVGSRALFSPEPLEKAAEGDFFVIAKNIKPPESFEEHWRKDHPPHIAKAMLGAASLLREALKTNKEYVHFHDLIDAYFQSERLDFMKVEAQPVLHHSAHSQLDFYVRNFKSVFALEELKDFPVHVFGRGWDELTIRHSYRHSFFPGRNAQDSRELYNSRYGLIDISPAQGLHDRSKRALANKTSFATNAQMDSGYEPEKFPTLFFSLYPGSLRQTAEVIMTDPNAHRQACADFSSVYQKMHQPQDLLFRVENFARSLVQI